MFRLLHHFHPTAFLGSVRKKNEQLGHFQKHFQGYEIHSFVAGENWGLDPLPLGKTIPVLDRDRGPGFLDFLDFVNSQFLLVSRLRGHESSSSPNPLMMQLSLSH
jgi:hypothetical protein